MPWHRGAFICLIGGCTTHRSSPTQTVKLPVGMPVTTNHTPCSYEVEANVFRFFGSRIVEFDAGRIQNNPLQLGVRSVVEMAVYQIMTDYLGLPATPGCAVARTASLDTVQGDRT